MQALYYAPIIERFYSNAPVGYTAKNPVMSFNRNTYVNNNPYKFVDPVGEWLQFVVIAAKIVHKAYEFTNKESKLQKHTC
ncbi:RHS repeat-associated protein [Pleionea mediterranea]|uniref:RHS repeat-associated protein n=2 Tax=Pleionea mediterranea TaxID=523701 RepID=A0A316G127_9GAMM|nr:RHS repeat-associated protein [Pleionea mediterranea]